MLGNSGQWRRTAKTAASLPTQNPSEGGGNCEDEEKMSERKGFNIQEIQVLLDALRVAIRVGEHDLAKDIRMVFDEHNVTLTETPEGWRFHVDLSELS